MLQFARWLVILGVAFILAGGVLYLLARAGFSPGRMPGNVVIQSGNMTCVFALGASILLSVLLTLALNLLARFLNR